ncbi:caspase family protein [Pseudorhodoplanes sp.]|uniref:caspase family protein n=1 Tax=Pseudorhodoplanes sp. TaxID=1934341 RepID=UPI003D13733F
MFRKGFASFLIAAAATAALSSSVTAQVRTAALQSSGFQLAQAAQAETRVALVIGNSAYQTNKPLSNPVNDAQAVSQMLNQAGFEVVMAFDLTRDIMKQTVEEFAARILEKGENTVAMVYYAGHGMQVDGENYLIPIDAKFQGEDDLPDQGVKLADVVAALEATKTKARIVVVDACRNNPFGGSANDDNGGLALVDAPEGALIAYSTAPGTVAFDGLGKHSPYASAFMRTARTPNLPVEQVFKKVRLLVNDSTDKKQTPWDSARLNTEFVFFPNAETPVAPVVVPAKVAVNELASRPVRQAYEVAIAEDKEEYYEEFVRVYAADPLADHVRRLLNRRKQMVAWQNVTHRNRPEDYADFARRFRDSGLGRAARRLQERPRQINIAFPRRGEGRFGDGRFGNVRINVGNDGRRVIRLGGREGFGNGGRRVINFANVGNGNNGRPGFGNNGNGNNGRPGFGNNNGGRPVINQNGNNNGGRPVINQNGNNNGGRPVINQNGNNNGGRPVINQNGNNNGGRPVINQNGNNNGGRPVINQNGNNNGGRPVINQNGNNNVRRPVINQGRPQFQRPQVQRPQFERPQFQRPQVQRPQVQRPQFQQRQTFQAPRQNFQPRAFNGGGGGGGRFVGGGGGGGRFGGGGFGGGRGGGRR